MLYQQFPVVPARGEGGLARFLVVSLTTLAGGTVAMVRQVWSLTQFYSVDFSKSRIDVKSAFSTNAHSMFASVVVDGVLGPPRLARHT